MEIVASSLIEYNINNDINLIRVGFKIGKIKVWNFGRGENKRRFLFPSYKIQCYKWSSIMYQLPGLKIKKLEVF